MPSDRFVSDHAGEWGATLYMSVFYLYLGAASAVCAFQWALATLDTRRRHLRIGLGMMTFAMFIGVGYTVSRTLFLWISVVDEPSEAFALRFDQVTEAAQLVLFAFFALGASVPAFAAGARRARLWRAQVRLHALWYELMAAFPDQPFDPPASLARELTRFNVPADLRVDRWAADIADAAEKLRHYVPDGLLAAAARAAAHDTDDPRRAESLTDAYWIRAALLAKDSGAPAAWSRDGRRPARGGPGRRGGPAAPGRRRVPDGRRGPRPRGPRGGDVRNHPHDGDERMTGTNA